MCRHGADLRSDEDFKKFIKVIHLDGSEFYLENCSWDEDVKRVYIWTEHCGYFYFYKEDIAGMEIKTYDVIADTGVPQMVEHTYINFNLEVNKNGYEANETEISN